jgi:hypothetical protein
MSSTSPAPRWAVKGRRGSRNQPRESMAADASCCPVTVSATVTAAFYAAMIGFLDRHLPLVLAVDTGSARFEVGAYGFWRAHVRSLLAEAAVPDPDALVDALLAPLAAEVFRFQRASGVTPAQVADGLAHLARRVVGDPGT